MQGTVLVVLAVVALALPTDVSAQEWTLRLPLGLQEQAMSILEDNPFTQETHERSHRCLGCSA